MSEVRRLAAPAKINLCLYLGEKRADGLHELCSVFAPISLADRLAVTDADGSEDEVVVAGIEQPDLTGRALAALREAGWKRAPLRIEVDKRIPVAAGLGGGSADAAAVLRLAAGFIEPADLIRIAARLGADVPSQIDPRFSLVGGAGEQVTPLPDPDPFALVLIPDREGLSTPAVFAEADRLGSPRPAAEIEERRSALAGAFSTGGSVVAHADLLVNDLAEAAISLRPSITDSLCALEEAGAALARVTGSGPTACGIFPTGEDAERAADEIRAGGREAIVALSPDSAPSGSLG